MTVVNFGFSEEGITIPFAEFALFVQWIYQRGFGDASSYEVPNAEFGEQVLKMALKALEERKGSETC